MRILILGGNGMIGHKMYQVISKEFDDVWVLLKKPLDQVHSSEIFKTDKVIESFNLVHFDKLSNVLKDVVPTAVISLSIFFHKNSIVSKGTSMYSPCMS